MRVLAKKYIFLVARFYWNFRHGSETVRNQGWKTPTVNKRASAMFM